jgi:DNA polymerase (family 10)
MSYMTGPILPDKLTVMAANQELAAMFDRMAKVLELQGANRFRVNAYERAARTLENITEDIADHADSVKSLTAFEGIGDGMAHKIIEYLQTGDVEEYHEVTGEVPEGLLEVLEVPGLGPKTVKRLWEEAMPLGHTGLALTYLTLEDPVEDSE